MSGDDPDSIARRLLQLELQAPQALPEEGKTADATGGAAGEKEEGEDDGEIDEEDEDDDVDDSEEEEEGANGEPEDLDELMELIVSSSRRDRFLGAQSLRRRVSDRYEAPGYSRLLTSPALAALIANLESDGDPDLQFESVWALTNLLAGSGARPTDLVGSSGLGRPLIRLLRSAPSDKLREQACWALANVAGESAAWRDQLLASEGDLVTALTDVWDADPNDGLLDASALLLVNLCRDRQPRLRLEIAQRLLPRALRLLRHPYVAAVSAVVWAVSYAVEDSEPRARLLLQDTEAVACLVGFLECGDDALVMPTMRLFCSLSASLDPLPACLLEPGEAGLLAVVRRLMEHRDAKLRRQALLFFGTLSGGPTAQLEAAARAGCLIGVGRILSGSVTPETTEAEQAAATSAASEEPEGAVGGGGISVSVQERREAFWIVPNFMLSRGHKFSQRIVDECLEGFLASLNLQEADISRCVLLCVRHLLFAARYKNRPDLDFEALKRKIETCGGLKHIEQVQSTSEDKDLVKLSHQIMDQFFWGNEQKYLDERGSSQEASPSPMASDGGGSEIGDDGRQDGGREDDDEEKETPLLSALIGGLQAGRE